MPSNSIIDINKKPESDNMQVFYHHIYEYKKGIRNLVLHTEKAHLKNKIETRLQKDNIDYLIHNINPTKINIYFGNTDCVNVVKSFNTHKLNELSQEQDFILGIMLGYDRLKQCERYLTRLNMNNQSLKIL